MDKFWKHRNFHEWVTSITVVVMYGVINSTIALRSILSSFPVVYRYIEQWHFGPLIDILIALILSKGIYTVISTLVGWGTGKWRWLKSFVLGRKYFEGMWVGYIEEDGGVTFIVEEIQQSFDEVTVTGRSYKVDASMAVAIDSDWKSIIAKIDVEASGLEYAYENISRLKGEKDFRGYASCSFTPYSNDNNEFRKAMDKQYPLIKSFDMTCRLLDFNEEGQKIISEEIKVTDKLGQAKDSFVRYAYEFWKFRKHITIV